MPIFCLPLLVSMSAARQPTLLKMPKSSLVRIHETFPSGEEVAYLEKC
jgi:hypothetical protein